MQGYYIESELSVIKLVNIISKAVIPPDLIVAETGENIIITETGTQTRSRRR